MVNPNLYGGSDQYHVGKVRKRTRWLVWLVAGVILIIVVVLSVFVLRQHAAAPQAGQAYTEAAPQAEEPQPAEEPAFDTKALQSTVDTWAKNHPGTYSVVVADANNKKLATHQADTQYFTASIYKLYVAYEGYRRIDDGTYSPDQPYLGSYTRGECLDKMIRESYSPCAEKMWAELGKEKLNTTLKSYGLENTSMTGLYTSAADAAIMLGRIERGEGLSKSSRAKLLESMKKQIYRDALPAGFNKGTVYDKVGFKEKVEYHDVAIVQLEQGTLIVSVLTKNAGTKNIAGLASAIQSAATR